jgi:5-methylcytosine-specific restriction endonuclease McrA
LPVFVLDKRKRPLMPCTEKRARLMLERGRAVVHKRFPFTIRLKDRVGGDVQPVRVKIDPGASVSGMAVVREDGPVQHVLHLAEVQHRGKVVKKHLQQRTGYRRRRRSQNLRYREKRFDNRRRSDGWLPPSLRSRMDNVLSWVDRYRRLVPVTGVSIERVRFDMQAMQNPDIEGVQYQQGELRGYEVREYLLEKHGRCCAYCGARGTPLQVEHIRPKALGGSDRISNLTLACHPCNQKKGSQRVEEFLIDRPEVLKRVLARAKAPLDGAAAVNATRNAIVVALRATGPPVETSSGGQTKWNRSRLGIPKTHALDAACVGAVDEVVNWQVPVLSIKAMGRGSYQRTRVTADGFPRGHLMRTKSVHGFQTGDIVRADVPKGKRMGVHVGRVAVRANGNFNIQTVSGTVTDIPHRHCRVIHRVDGYAYAQTDGSVLRAGRSRFLPDLKDGVPTRRKGWVVSGNLASGDRFELKINASSVGLILKPDIAARSDELMKFVFGIKQTGVMSDEDMANMLAETAREASDFGDWMDRNRQALRSSGPKM